MIYSLAMTYENLLLHIVLLFGTLTFSVGLFSLSNLTREHFQTAKNCRTVLLCHHIDCALSNLHLQDLSST